MADCPFCAIVRGEAEADLVLEEDATLAFLDNRPLFAGHSLLVPRTHVETLADLPDALIGPLFASARLLAQAVEVAFGATGSFVAMNNRVSQSVPHLHVHVVPRRPKDGLRGFFWPRTKYRDEAHAREARDALRAAVAELTPATRRPRVELLWWAGCPSWERAVAELRDAMSETGLDPADLVLTEVLTERQAQTTGFVGSPTIRVDGMDVQPPGDQPAGLTCRVYHLRDGRVSPLPDPADLHDVLASIDTKGSR